LEVWFWGFGGRCLGFAVRRPLLFGLIGREGCCS
jgi:hypothetical protein